VSKLKNYLENQKNITADELVAVREIQDIYMTNLRCLGYNPKIGIIKKSIKDSRKTVALFNKINFDFLFDDGMLTKYIDKFEDKAIKSNFIYFDYEDVMIRIHGNLREIGYGICVDHNINIHHCERCHERLGLDSEL
tara:strand:+ start:172 stop:582 length:411 start_codon:yes stop_codon:yes gene_type:complete